MSDPKDFFLKKADKLKKSGKFEESVKFYDKVQEVKDQKKKSDYWYKRGISMFEIKNYDQALECFNKDLKFNEPSFKTFYQKGLVFFALKKFLDAVESFNKAWEIKFSEFLKFTDQAKTLKNHQKFEKSVLYFDKAKNLKTIPSGFWTYRGLALNELGKFEEAIKCYREALEINPNELDLTYELAKSYLKMEKPEKCLKLLDEVCKADSKKRERLKVDPAFESLQDNEKFIQIRDG